MTQEVERLREIYALFEKHSGLYDQDELDADWSRTLEYRAILNEPSGIQTLAEEVNMGVEAFSVYLHVQQVRESQDSFYSSLQEKLVQLHPFLKYGETSLTPLESLYRNCLGVMDELAEGQGIVSVVVLVEGVLHFYEHLQQTKESEENPELIFKYEDVVMKLEEKIPALKRFRIGPEQRLLDDVTDRADSLYQEMLTLGKTIAGDLATHGLKKADLELLLTNAATLKSDIDDDKDTNIGWHKEEGGDGKLYPDHERVAVLSDDDLTAFLYG